MIDSNFEKCSMWWKCYQTASNVMEKSFVKKKSQCNKLLRNRSHSKLQQLPPWSVSNHQHWGKPPTSKKIMMHWRHRWSLAFFSKFFLVFVLFCGAEDQAKNLANAWKCFTTEPCPQSQWSILKLRYVHFFRDIHFLGDVIIHLIG